MRVYIGGPLSGSNHIDYLKNVHKMIEVGDELRRLGFSVYLPCLDLLLGIYAGDMEYKDYQSLNAEWVSVAEALLVIDHSPGTDAEIMIAASYKIPVFYTVADLEYYRLVAEGGRNDT